MWESRCETISAWWEEKRPVSARRSSGSFAPQLAARQLGQSLGIVSALAELGEHRPPGDAEHPGRDRGELDVGVH